MMKPLGWMQITGQRIEGHTVFVNVRVRVRHPAFLWMLWGAMRQESRRYGVNPNDPWVLWVMSRHLVRIFVKGK